MEAQRALDNASKERIGNGETCGANDAASTLVTSDEPASLEEVESLSQARKGADEELKDFILRTCVWCKRQNDPTLEFLVRSPGVWLHALQYTVRLNHDVHSFRTTLPTWSIID